MRIMFDARRLFKSAFSKIPCAHHVTGKHKLPKTVKSRGNREG